MADHEIQEYDRTDGEILDRVTIDGPDIPRLSVRNWRRGVEVPPGSDRGHSVFRYDLVIFPSGGTAEDAVTIPHWVSIAEQSGDAEPRDAATVFADVVMDARTFHNAAYVGGLGLHESLDDNRSGFFATLDEIASEYAAGEAGEGLRVMLSLRDNARKLAAVGLGDDELDAAREAAVDAGATL
jgi:hypothetical protein